MNKKILLVNPHYYLHLPLGLLYIAAVLERDYLIKILEIKEKDINKKRERLIGEIERFNPDFIGFSFMTSQSETAYSLMKAVKNIKSGLPIICGGPHPTFMPKEVISNGADYVIVGEGERIVPILLDTLSKGGDIKSLEGNKGVVFKTNLNNISQPQSDFIEDLNSLPMPAYHLLDSKDERFSRRRHTIRGFWLRCASIGTSRGCPARCTFCGNHIFAGRKVRERNIDSIMDEIGYLKERYHIEAFWIIDDTFAFKTERVLEFCSKLIDRRFGLKWACHARCNTFKEEMALAMKKAGCLMVDFGVESGSQKVLDAMKKGIKVQHIYRSFEACHKAGLKTLANIMIGFPGETSDDIAQTKKVLRDIRPYVVMPSFTTPFPGSILYDLAIKNGWINEKEGIKWETHNEPSLCVNFSKEELMSIYEDIYKEHRLSRRYLFNINFLIDIVKFFISKPSVFFKIIYLVITFKEHKVKNIIAEEFI